MKLFRKSPITIIILTLILLITIIGLVTKDQVFSETENKYLAKFPVVTVSTVTGGEFTRGYENYISDQFLFRDKWIYLKAFCEELLLKTENNDIVYGKDGYLFPKFYTFDSKALQRNLASLDKFSASMTAPVAIMILPSKYYPLVDYLPPGYPFIDQNYYISSINDYLSANSTIVDAKDILSINSQDYIYYRTDHHWTNYGAYLAYTQLASVIGFTPFEYDQRQVRRVSDQFLGTNYTKSHKVLPLFDYIEYFDFSIENLNVDGTDYDTLYDMEQFTKRDKYAAFIHGNNGLTIVESQYSEDKFDSILIIKDSFANSLIPLLTEHYNTIYAIDPRFYNFQQGYAQYADMHFDQVLIIYSFETLVAPNNINYISLDFD